MVRNGNISKIYVYIAYSMTGVDTEDHMCILYNVF